MTPRQRELTDAFSAGRLSWEAYQAAFEAATPRGPAKRPKLLDRPPPADVPPWCYAKLAERVSRDRRLGNTPRALLAVLLRLARARGACDAYIDQLADMLGCSGRTVQRAQRRLEACGYLRVEHVRAPKAQGGRGSLNDANRYHLDPSASPAEPAARRPRGGDKSVTPRRRATPSLPLTPSREGEGRGAPLVAALPARALERAGPRLAARRSAERREQPSCQTGPP